MTTDTRELLGVYRNTPQQRLVGGTIRLLERVSPQAAAALAERLFTTPARHAARDREKPVMARATGRRLRFDAGELQLYEWGSGPLVLLVHGWAGRPGQFATLIEALLKAGYRVLSFDWPGHGLSSGKRSNAYLASRAIRAIVAAEGAPAAIVSHSVGGMSVALALEAGVTTERLVMINTPTDPLAIYATFARALNLPAATGRRMLARFEARLGRPFASLDMVKLAHVLPADTLLIHDRDDDQVPVASSRRVIAARPGLALHETRGLGHNRVLGDAAVVALAVGYLRGETAQENQEQSQG